MEEEKEEEKENSVHARSDESDDAAGRAFQCERGGIAQLKPHVRRALTLQLGDAGT